MLKRTMIAVVVAVTALTATAQDKTVQNKPYIDLRPMHFGILVGLNLQDIELQNVGPQTVTLEDGTVMQQTIERLSAYGRPLVCTEWMNRPRHSTITDIMPLLRQQRVGSMIWGLVNGKTQTHLPWGHRPEHGPYTGPWQHDIFHTDHTPYDASEIALIRQLTSTTHSLATFDK